jgi:hypothetical protein
MDEPVARFEFRTFSQCFDMTEQILRAMASCDSISESREIYFLDDDNNYERNLKIRDGKLEQKRLVENYQGLQRWQPAGQWSFPVTSATLRELLGPNVNLDSDSLPGTLTKDGLLGFIAQADIPLSRANVFKRRFRFSPGNCKAELDQLLVNGAAIQSVAIEAEDRHALLALRIALQLEDRENLAYPQALSRILGKASLPDEQDYG